jgi:hypothetical protein
MLMTAMTAQISATRTIWPVLTELVVGDAGGRRRSA